MWRCLSFFMGYRTHLTLVSPEQWLFVLSCLFYSDAEKFCILKLGVSVLRYEFFTYVACVLECYCSRLAVYLLDLAKSTGQMLALGDQFTQSDVFCVNKGAQTNVFGFIQMLQILNAPWWHKDKRLSDCVTEPDFWIFIISSDNFYCLHKPNFSFLILVFFQDTLFPGSQNLPRLLSFMVFGVVLDHVPTSFFSMTHLLASLLGS